MWRIRDGLMKYAPPEVRFVNRYEKADIHILDFIGQHPRIDDKIVFENKSLFQNVPSLPKCDKYILIYHCPPDPHHIHSKLHTDYQKLFEKAILVLSL